MAIACYRGTIARLTTENNQIMPHTIAKNLSLIAAIDLGSNSFHMVVAKAHHTEIRILERLGEKVQLAISIDEERMLSEEAMERAWIASSAFPADQRHTARRRAYRRYQRLARSAQP